MYDRQCINMIFRISTILIQCLKILKLCVFWRKIMKMFGEPGFYLVLSDMRITFYNG
jgi:hypothetical protein